MLTKFREPVNGLTHLFAAIVSAIGLSVLISLYVHSMMKGIAVGIYGLSLVLLFGARASYHLVKAGPKIIALLRKFDHSAIYLLIAGTYTPFCTLMFTGFWKWGLLGIIWSLAVIGIVVKMFIMDAPRWLTAGVYVMMGWLCLSAIGEMLRVLPLGALLWLVA